jgi:uncharacterized protein YecT (DUF1311 family)
LQKKARTAFDREMAREKSGDCPKAMSTSDVSHCLYGEIGITTGNYKEYTGAILALLTQRGDETVKQFNDVEAFWEKYRDLQCEVAADLYRGGTARPSIGMGCHLRLLRSRMRDLDGFYYIPLHN